MAGFVLCEVVQFNGIIVNWTETIRSRPLALVLPTTAVEMSLRAIQYAERRLEIVKEGCWSLAPSGYAICG